MTCHLHTKTACDRVDSSCCSSLAACRQADQPWGGLSGTRARTIESRFVVDDELLTESRVLSAYEVLFVDAGEASGSLLRSLQLPEIKKAYRRRALDTHPDRWGGTDEGHRKRCTERFIEVTNAYEILNSYLALRDKGVVFEREEPAAWEPSRRARPAPASQPGFASSSDDDRRRAFSFSYWERGVPGRGLRFGEFLYYSQVIPWKSLIAALVWQRRERPRIGEIAQRWRWFTEPEIVRLLKGRRPGEHLGEVLLRHRLISPFQLEVLLWQQRKFQKPIGTYFLRQGCLTQAQLHRYLQQQYQHNLRFYRDFPRHFQSWFNRSNY